MLFAASIIASLATFAWSHPFASLGLLALPLFGMAITNSIATTGPSFGSGFLVARTAIAVSSGSASAVPSTGSLTIPVYRGKIRVKVYNGAGTTPTLTKLQIAITDGTNTVIVGDWNFSTAVTLSSTNYADVNCNFCVDALSTAGGAVGALLAYGGSSAPAMVVNVTPTLGGTSPAATMDIEVYGEN